MTHPVIQARTRLDHSGQVLCGHTSKDMFAQDRINVDTPGHASKDTFGPFRTSVMRTYKQGHIRTRQDKC